MKEKVKSSNLAFSLNTLFFYVQGFIAIQRNIQQTCYSELLKPHRCTHASEE